MLANNSIANLHQLIIHKKISIKELVLDCLTQIEKHEPLLNTFITQIDQKSLLKQADVKQKSLTLECSPLYGIPYVLKDSYLTKGIRTTAGSNVLKEFIPPYNATVVNKLNKSGAILLGKMNMDAWGHGGSTENTDFKPTKNPYDPSRVAGGSSGGPAAAIAARMCLFAIGEDTGGSIRNPAAWTNTTGLKVTYGRVSRYGCISYASSFDTVGPMAKSVEDCAVVLSTIAGHDPKDATSSPRQVDDYHSLLNNPQPLTIGVPTDLFTSVLDQEMRSIIEKQIRSLKTMGHQVKKISLPLLSQGLNVYYLIGPSETSSNLGRYDGVRYGLDRSNFTSETMRRIMIGTYALSAGYYDAFYRQAQKVRTLIINEFANAFSQVDILAMPVNPTPPTVIGQLINDPLTNMTADIYTTTHNPAGIPSLALPAGFTKSGLPVGLQLSGPLFSEARLLTLGYQLEKSQPYYQQLPKIIE